MIDTGTKAPGFSLQDHLGRTVTLEQFAGKRHVMLLFYPLDFTPTWSREIPDTERLLPRFRAAHTQVLGVSIDSVHCHANWAASLGGVSFPLLADFQPKGAMAASYGLYLEDAGITDRATVIIDAGGVVRQISSVGPGGSRDIEALAALCEGVDQEHGQGLPDFPEPAGLTEGTLYVKSNCGFSLRTLNARANLHLQEQLKLVNVSEDAAALGKLKELTGKETAPCLVLGGESLHEADDIVLKLASLGTDL